MIRVTVELVSANTGKTTTLGTAKISNDGSGMRTKGNYSAVFYRRDGRVWKECRVLNFPRLSLLWWDLLYRALKEVCGERNR